MRTLKITVLKDAYKNVSFYSSSTEKEVLIDFEMSNITGFKLALTILGQIVCNVLTVFY